MLFSYLLFAITYLSQKAPYSAVINQEMEAGFAHCAAQIGGKYPCQRAVLHYSQLAFLHMC